MTKREPWQDPPVHPAADMLPMMSDAELDDLAADIKANGLLEPSPSDSISAVSRRLMSCRVRLPVRRRGSRLPANADAQRVQNPQPLVRCSRRQFAHTHRGPRLAATPLRWGSIK